MGRGGQRGQWTGEESGHRSSDDQATQLVWAYIVGMTIVGLWEYTHYIVGIYPGYGCEELLCTVVDIYPL